MVKTDYLGFALMIACILVSLTMGRALSDMTGLPYFFSVAIIADTIIGEALLFALFFL